MKIKTWSMRMRQIFEYYRIRIKIGKVTLANLKYEEQYKAKNSKKNCQQNNERKKNVWIFLLDDR